MEQQYPRQATLYGAVVFSGCRAVKESPRPMTFATAEEERQALTAFRRELFSANPKNMAVIVSTCEIILN